MKRKSVQTFIENIKMQELRWRGVEFSKCERDALIEACETLIREIRIMTRPDEDQ